MPEKISDKKKLNTKPPILELKNITKTFLNGKIVANNNISLIINYNEIHALVGENGSGKSTLMNIIFGLYKQNKGDIFIENKKVDMFLSGAAKQQKIGMVHQHFHLVENFSVLENIILGQEQPEVDKRIINRLKNRISDLEVQIYELQQKDWDKNKYLFLKAKEKTFYNSKQLLLKLNEKLENYAFEISKEEKNLLRKNQIDHLKLKNKLGTASDDNKNKKIVNKKFETLENNDTNSKLEKLKRKRTNLHQKIENQQVIINEFENEYKESHKDNPVEYKILKLKISLYRTQGKLKSNIISKWGILYYKNALKRFEIISKKYNIDVDPNIKVNKLSVGQRQMVEILKVLWETKKIIVFDEPTATLSISEIEELMKTIISLKNEGKTIIFISHKLNEVKKVADRVSILRKGNLVSTHENDNKLDTEKIIKEMIGRNIQLKYLPRNISDNVLLKVRNLTYETAKGFIAINDINFDIYEGEIFGLAGIEGNGQEEVLKIITGLRRPKIGEILFKDEVIVSANDHNLQFMSIKDRNKFIAHVPIDRSKYGIISDKDLSFNSILSTFDSPSFSKIWLSKKDEKTKKILNSNIAQIAILKQNLKDLKRNNNAPGATVAEQNINKIKKENKKIIRTTKGYSFSIDYNLVIENTKKIIKESRVEGALNHSVLIKNLSGGNQQKFVFGRELIRNHELFVAGHPTRGLDIAAIDYVYRQMIDNAKGKATILYSLEINELIAVCDRMAIMYKGKIIDIIDPRKTSFTKISKMMVGRK